MELKGIFRSIILGAVVPVLFFGLVILFMEYLQNIKGV